MANGHVEIHDPFSHQNTVKSSAAGSEDGDHSEGMEDTPEFRLLKAFVTRRCDVLNGHHTSGAIGHEETDKKSGTKKKKKKKKGIKNVFFRCIKPKTSDEDVDEETPASHPDSKDRALPVEKEKLELEDAAKALAEIADEIPFVQPLESDSPEEEDVEKVIALVLREAGDRLNDQKQNDVSILKDIIWNYGFFRKLMNELLLRMGLSSADPESPGPHASTKTQIAVTCEATRRLSLLHTLPRNRVLGCGARFISENFSSWVQEQGGYDVAFKSEAEDEVE